MSQRRERRPSVVDTLDHAKKALSTHRKWLQRKISSTDEREEGGATKSGREEEEGGGGWKKKRESRTAVSPTSRPLSTETVEWVTFLKEKRNTAKVSPIPALENVEQEEEEDERGKVARFPAGMQVQAWTSDIVPGMVGGAEGGRSLQPSQRWGNAAKDISPSSLSPSSFPSFPSSFPSSPTSFSRAKRHSRLKRRSNCVFPSPSSYSAEPQDGLVRTKAPVHLFTSPSSPISTSPLTPHPPRTSAIVLTGSLTSLDRYMETLGDGCQLETDVGSPPVGESVAPSGVGGAAAGDPDSELLKSFTQDSYSQQTHSQSMPEREQGLNTPTHTTLHGTPTSDTITTTTTISHDHSNSTIRELSSSPMNSDPKATHPDPVDTPLGPLATAPYPLATPPSPTPPSPTDLEVLRSESRATVIAVSPAPPNRQSSYETHTHPKLDCGGRDTMQDVRRGGGEGGREKEEGEGDIRVISPRQLASGGREMESVPEAVMVSVHPSVGGGGGGGGGGGVRGGKEGGEGREGGEGEGGERRGEGEEGGAENGRERVSKDQGGEVRGGEGGGEVRGGREVARGGGEDGKQGRGRGGGDGRRGEEEAGGGEGGGDGRRGGGERRNGITFRPQFTSTPTFPPVDGEGGREGKLLHDLQLPPLKPAPTSRGGLQEGRKRKRGRVW